MKTVRVVAAVIERLTPKANDHFAHSQDTESLKMGGNSRAEKLETGESPEALSARSKKKLDTEITVRRWNRYH